MSVMKNKKNFPGLDGFVWWTGIVEGRQDPIKLGRIQVRCFGWHTENKQLIPSEELLWAQPSFSPNSHQTTHTPKEGEMVFGFFLDGEDAQFPICIGVIPSIPGKIYDKKLGFSDPGKEEDVKKRPIPVHIGKPTRYPNEKDLDEPTTSRLARNENLDKTPLQISKGSEKPFYGAKYPYNCSTMTESGHYIDYDDTPGAERITLLHRSGSFIEMKPDGDVKVYATKDLYLIGEKDVNIIAKTGSIIEKAQIKIDQTAPIINENTPIHNTTGIHTDSIGIHSSV